MEDFRVKNGLKLRALALAVDRLGDRAAPSLGALEVLHQTIVAEAWRVLAWASAPDDRHAAAVGEGIAVRTARLGMDETTARRLRGRPRLSQTGPRVWGAVLDGLKEGPFGGRCPVLAYEAGQGSEIRMPTEVVHYEAARRGLLPHASVAGALAMATRDAPDDVRAAQLRLRTAIDETMPAACARVEAAYAPTAGFAAKIESCVMASDLARAFPGAESLLGGRCHQTGPMDTEAAELLRSLHDA